MKSNAKPPRRKPNPRPKRTEVLVLVESDGYFTARGENVDACIVVVPSSSRECESLAIDVVELLTPPRFRHLLGDGYVRANGICRAVRPTTLRRALATNHAIRRLNELQDAAKNREVA